MLLPAPDRSRPLQRLPPFYPLQPLPRKQELSTSTRCLLPRDPLRGRKNHYSATMRRGDSMSVLTPLLSPGTLRMPQPMLFHPRWSHEPHASYSTPIEF